METLSYPTELKANKEHECNFCLLPIEKGHKYLKSSHKNDGEIYTWKSHIYCSEVLDKIGAWDDGDGIDSEAFRECISNEYRKLNNTESEYPKFSERLKIVLEFHKLQQ